MKTMLLVRQMQQRVKNVLIGAQRAGGNARMYLKIILTLKKGHHEGQCYTHGL